MAKIQTDKQRKLVKLLSENLGLKKPKTMLQMMLEAGYEESTAHQQTSILVGIREELDPIVKKLIAHRERILTQLAKKLPQAKYRDLVDGLDKVTKNIQLLSGKPTERPNNVITGLENLTDKQLDEFIKSRKSGTGSGTH
jgi:hypothetical protein